MARPIPGQNYTVENGDTLSRIAGRAYGDETRADFIGRANQVDGVSSGDVILIPRLGITRTSGSQEAGISLLIGGRPFPTESILVMQSLDTFVHGWSATLARLPGQDPEAEKLFRPYAYPDASVFLDGEELVRGALYTPAPGLGGRSEISLAGWSSTADLYDSVLEPPYEAEKVNLERRAQVLAEVHGVSVVSRLAEDGLFDRVTAGETDTKGQHLLNLARQRGVLLTSELDNLVLFKLPNTNGPVVGTIEEGQPGFSGFASKFDGRQRFSSYRITADAPDLQQESITVRDKGVPRPRFAARSAGELRRGELGQAADWIKNKSLADALTIPITGEGFFAPNGQRWAPGQFVNFISPTLFIPKAFKMLVRSVDFKQERAGDSTVLGLVPPSVYTGGQLVEPWG